MDGQLDRPWCRSAREERVRTLIEVAAVTSTIVRDGKHSSSNLTRRRRATPRLIARLGEPRWVSWGVVGVAGAAVGAASAELMPRGPLSAGPGVAVMVTGLLLGVVAGLVVRRRRAVLPVLLAYMAAVELVRWPIDGPTVDGMHLGSTYGVIGFVTGRGFDGLLLAIPAFLGGAYGVRLARWWSRPDDAEDDLPRRRWAVLLHQLPAGLCAVALVWAAVYVGQPGRTQPIRTADGAVLAGSIAELGTVHVGGHDTTMLLRGNSIKAPVLLYLAGGPGGTDLGAMRLFGEALERDFVVATWDQRGAGASYRALDPTSTLTLDRAVKDTIEVVEQLRSRFDKDKVYVVGNSWGTILGVLAVQKRPDLFAAYVGTGQMVSPAATDQMFYEDTISWATRIGNTNLVKTLESNGPPPYGQVFPYEPALSHEHDWNHYAMVPAYAARGELPANLFVPEYDLVQKVRGINSFLDTFAVLYPQLQDIDFRSQATALRVPVYLVEGESEARGRVVPAREWFALLDAPTKKWVELPQSGHRPQFEQPAAFADVMRAVVAETR